MMNTLFRFASLLLALAFIGFVGCKDSGHSLGDSRDHDAGSGDTSVSAGGSTWSHGASSSSAVGGSTGGGGSFLDAAAGGSSGAGSLSSGAVGSSSSTNGGSGGGSAGRGGSSAASDAGVKGDTSTGTCGYRGDSCASRPCCGPLVCMNFTSPPSCYESSPPPPDAGRDTRVSGDTQCPACPAMKCSYGSPKDSNGCTLCECNPGPDGGADTSPPCPAGGCLDADLSTPCPASPPSSGSPCLGQTVCNYEDCPGAGHTQATCRSDKWVVANGACGTVTCLGAGAGRTCAANKVCLIHAGGALLVDCIDNPCASGLVSADCSTMTTGCTPILSTSSGLTFYCDTCPTGICA